jgi:uncharacterized protein (TIGR02996 family)
MSQAESFIRAILEQPDEDATCLVYADWLDDHGEPDRADLVRTQVELARLGPDDPRREDLSRRERELREAHREEWTPFLKLFAGRASAGFQRGLLYGVYVKDARDDDLRHLAGRWEVRELTFEGQGFTDAGLEPLLAFPYLESLGLSRTAVTDEGMRVTARLPRLRGLGLTETPVTDAGLLHLHDAARLARIWCEEESQITEEALERWKERRMQRFRLRSEEERRRETAFVIPALSHTMYEGAPLTELDLWGCPVTDPDMEYFTALPEVEKIDLTKTGITGQGLRHLAGLKRLHTLYIHQTRAVDLAGLAGLPSLKELGANSLRGAGPDDRLTDEGAAALETLTGLETLDLAWAAVTDATLRRLAALKRLRALNLYGNDAITDDGLRHLAGLTELRILDLEDQPVTDAGLVHLRGLKELERLNLEGTRATVEGVERLLAFLPRASITVAGSMVKHTNANPSFTRRAVDARASFEVPDDWDVREWTSFPREGAEWFQANLWEDGYKHWTGGRTSSSPGEVWFYRFPAGAQQDLVEVHRAFVRGTNYGNPGSPGDEAEPLPGVEALSWRYADEHLQYLDFAWRLGETCYLMRYSAPVARFAGLEPFFLRMGRSFRLSASGDSAGGP